MAEFLLILFNSVNRTMWAERALKGAGVAFKLIPIPRNVSSDCGVCIRIVPADEVKAREALTGVVEPFTLHPL